MKVQAEVSLYPLRQNDLTEPVRQLFMLSSGQTATIM